MPNKSTFTSFLIFGLLVASPFMAFNLGKKYQANKIEDQVMEQDLKDFEARVDEISLNIKNSLTEDQRKEFERQAKAEFKRQQTPPSQDEVMKQWLEDIKIYNQ